MLAELFGLLEHTDLDLAELGVLFHELRELDGTRETRGPAADEHDVHWDRFIVGLVLADELVDGQLGLVLSGNERTSSDSELLGAPLETEPHSEAPCNRGAPMPPRQRGLAR